MRKAPLAVGRDASRDRIDSHRMKRPTAIYGSRNLICQRKNSITPFSQRSKNAAMSSSKTCRPRTRSQKWQPRAGMNFHTDNGNNSLRPPTSERRHAQLNFWFYLEDVDAEQAPTLFVAKTDGRDERKRRPLSSPPAITIYPRNVSNHRRTLSRLERTRRIRAFRHAMIF